MTAAPGKAPKKEKEKKQTPEERLQALRYNHMMYGPTAGEMRPAAKKVNYGTAYLNHPKFQSLLAAFKKGTAFSFEVTDKGRAYPIATGESHLSFDGKVVFYSRHLNKYEDHLLMDRSVAVHCQGIEAFVHLVFAVLRSFPDLEGPALSYFQNQFYLGGDTLDAGIAESGPNLLLGSFRHGQAAEKARK
ncbi:hypothetical protein GETHPA_25260 [Geothrix rubra]|uniref:Uncharacterized protein n=1 Tax=Geothrix rubra TaxID=2927977 RepID=A0ABQ5Q999_9BACT|nr:hypothetical protein [Geothrix rubra]GLH70993.1 hypothetical protein GETHPA_25260 [Geothrix rubra]